MTGYRADLESLAALAERLRGFDRRAEQLADDLAAAARRLHPQWTGAAASEHAAAQQRWASAHQRLLAAAGELQRTVRAAHTNYSAAAAANVRMWA